MAVFALQDLFSPAALAGLRRHPDFQEAADGFATASLGEFARADETGRWMFRDIGRSSLYLAAVILDSHPQGLTASTLATMARASGASSRGRVMSFIRRAQAAGELVVPPGAGPWTRRQLTLKAPFIERFRRGNRIYAEAVARLAPDVVHLLARLDDESFFRQFTTQVGATAAAAGQFAGSERMFLERDRGVSILFRLMISQDRPRARQLEAAYLSRSRLSREFGVSRVHINRLLSDAEATGLLACPHPDQVIFSARLSDDIEQMIAVTMQITRAALLAAEAQDSAGG